MVDFTFVPRKLAKSTTRAASSQKIRFRPASSHAGVQDEPQHNGTLQNSVSSQNDGGSSAKLQVLSDKEYATLMKLTLSDYAIETNSNLREEIERANYECKS